MTADTLTLSTGHEVALPLETRARLDAVAVGADATGVRAWLPDRLAPVRFRPGRALVVFVAVAYDRVGDRALAPYDEFGVFLAATPAGGREAATVGATTSRRDALAVPELGALRRGVGGYTVALPVTTEPARALGVEGWGYPKTVADVSVRERDGRRRATATDADGRLATIEVSVRPRVPLTVTTASFTASGACAGAGVDADSGTDSRPGAGSLDPVVGSSTDPEGVRRQPVELAGRVGARPLSGHVSLGDHPLAARLHSLEPGRGLLSVAFAGTVRVHPGERLPP